MGKTLPDKTHNATAMRTERLRREAFDEGEQLPPGATVPGRNVRGQASGPTGPKPRVSRSPEWDGKTSENRSRFSGDSSDAESSELSGTQRAWRGVGRGVAMFFGCFALLNVFRDSWGTGYDAHLWWIDLRPCPSSVARGFLALSGTLYILFATLPQLPKTLRRLTLSMTMALIGVACWNAIGFYRLVKSGSISAGFPVPFSVHIGLCLALIAMGMVGKQAQRSDRLRDAVIGFVAFLACAICFPIGQMFCYGMTDYRREADVAVIFGCRVYPDGRPSQALADRVLTGCELYRAKLVRKLLFSGGPGDGNVHETDAMKRLAMENGVDEADILIDRDGFNTQATVDRSIPQLRTAGLSRVLAVSHSYHLPRIKLCYQRGGLDVLTVPASELTPLHAKNAFIAREVAALWMYYLRPTDPAP